VILFTVGSALLIDARLGFFAGHADFVEENVVDYPLSVLEHVSFALQHVDVPHAIRGSRLVQSKHFLHELLLNKY